MSAEPSDNAMRRHWDRFARDDAMYYIATNRRHWKVEEFLESGRALAERIDAWIGPEARRDRMLEVGCGLCRTAVHFAARFRRVDALDVAPAMIERARSMPLPENLHLHLGNGRDLGGFPDGVFDLVHCAYVLQHVPELAVVRSYLVEMARTLTPGGLAAIQLDTRPPRLAVALYKALPDPLLPRPHRRFIRRYRRRPETVAGLLAASGLEVVEETGRGTGAHFLLLRRAAGGGA